MAMKVIINGIGGRMGHEVARLCSASEGYKGAEGICGVDPNANEPVFGIPCVGALSQTPLEGDCVIDFSHHSVTGALLAFCRERRLPLVLATTGHDEQEIKEIHAAAKEIPLFYSANMSLGVALLCELAKTAARTMPDADIEIVEKHHNRKLDAPSGTALMIADAISSVRQGAYYLFGRSGQRKRDKKEIGIHAIRMGNIVGEHEVLIGTDSQTITLKHEAHTRGLFAEGAVTAAAFLMGKPAGLYAMKDMIEQ